MKLWVPLIFLATIAPAQDASRQAALKADIAGQIDAMQKQAQVMVDSVFSFAELGFQETETTKYLTAILEKEGFRIERGVAGIPTAFVATWGQGKPVISLGSDIDDIPQASQKPGVAYRAPLVDGGPGHGEGHNSGMPMNILAAIAAKRVMEREKLPGTLKLWPGVAEELVGTKAHYVRAGLFKDVDIVLFAHVDSNFATSWGASGQNAMVSVEYTFQGEAAHAAGAPWRGHSALDAVELMDVGWNFRREHLRLAQRSHSVITSGGDQPNVVPPTASVWYYFRETDYEHVMDLWRIGDNMARAAALMTDTTFTSKLLGSAWGAHYNRPVAEVMQQNINRVGMPQWSDADQTLARSLQKELKVQEMGLPMVLPGLIPPRIEQGEPTGGPSDDIGDISWVVPTVNLRYPANITAGAGHSWANAVSMATPIAHKGVVAGAKVQAMTIVDLLLNPDLITKAWDYFRDEQTKAVQYRSFLRPDDKPAVGMNERVMNEFRPKQKPFYYDPSKYGTYLEQLGVSYPTVR